MENYYYKLVCVDENDPLEYRILEEENLENLEKVHAFVARHIEKHSPDATKWILIPFRKHHVMR